MVRPESSPVLPLSSSAYPGFPPVTSSMVDSSPSDGVNGRRGNRALMVGSSLGDFLFQAGLEEPPLPSDLSSAYISAEEFIFSVVKIFRTGVTVGEVTPIFTTAFTPPGRATLHLTQN